MIGSIRLRRFWRTDEFPGRRQTVLQSRILCGFAAISRRLGQFHLAFGVTLLEVWEAGPVPTELVAVTVKV